MKLLLFLLFPFTLIYDLITRFRNQLYNSGSKNSIRFTIPVICVGNIAVGGTGKTPHVEYLIRLLKDSHSVGVLSRGYGRKTKGFIRANEDSEPEEIGDEPYQIFNRFNSNVDVAVCEARAEGIPQMLYYNDNLNVILLDDAFQHRAVSPSFMILLTDYNRLLYKDFIMPTGRLRETRSNANRSDVAIVTKCPAGITVAEKNTIKSRLKRYLKKNQEVYFSGIKYGQPIAIGSSDNITKEVVAMTGIANTETFIDHLTSTGYQILMHFKLNDHHKYGDADIQKLKASIQEGQSIVVTEKDAVKLKQLESVKDLPIFYIPIESKILDREEEFNKEILQHIEQFDA